jgi:hypothetical protein
LQSVVLYPEHIRATFLRNPALPIKDQQVAVLIQGTEPTRLDHSGDCESSKS